MTSFSRLIIASVAICQVAFGQFTLPALPKAKGQVAMQAKADYWDSLKASGQLPRAEMTTLTGARQVCTGGKVTLNLGNGPEDFPCDNIDFESFISLPDLNITNDCFLDDSCIGPAFPGSTQGSDIWGWLSPEGREITIELVDNGAWFIDGTDPENPIRLGYIKSDRPQYSWGDVKVYNDTVYIVKDGTDTYDTYQNGIQVFDLKQLVCASAYTDGIPVEYFPQFVYRGHGSSHNVLIDNDAGFLYTVGVERFGKCLGGLHVVDIKTDPLRPQFVSCIVDDGYTHDAQCVTYDGPDTNFVGREICFAYNEDTITIWDVTDKQNAVILSKASYEGVFYTHQGWLTDDMKYILVDDELDEVDGGLNKTHTYVFDVSNLTNPIQKPTFIHADDSIDHNLYVWGSIHKRGWGGNAAMGANAPDLKYAYLSNYAAGLRVLDLTDIETGMNEVGFFDVAPDLDTAVFEGTWSNYMHPSGVVAVSSIDRGLFFLRPNMAYDGPAPTPQITPVPTAECPTPHPTTSPTVATPAPTGDCIDEEGLEFSNGQPAPCFMLFGYCSAFEIVRQQCRLTCDSCDEVFTDPPTFPDPTLSPTESTPAPTPEPSICTDTTNPGITLDDGTSVSCYEIRDFCSNNRVVRDRCPVTCGTCDKSSDVVALPESPDTDPEEVETVDLVIAAVAIVAGTAVVALAIFAAAVQVKSYRLVRNIAATV